MLHCSSTCGTHCIVEKMTATLSYAHPHQSEVLCSRVHQSSGCTPVRLTCSEEGLGCLPELPGPEEGLVTGLGGL